MHPNNITSDQSEHKRASPEEIKAWLRAPNKNCIAGDIYNDWGYSGYYKSMTSIYDDNCLFYEGSDDIDNRLKYPYHKSINVCDHIDRIEDFVDHIPSNISAQQIDERTCHLTGTDKKYAVHRLKYDPVFIPPGTNHSNANVLYKIIQKEFLNVDPFIIPKLPNDRSTEYDGDYVGVVPSIDKKLVYRFCYENSIHQSIDKKKYKKYKKV